jgi:hypothetical protein
MLIDTMRLAGYTCQKLRGIKFGIATPQHGDIACQKTLAEKVENYAVDYTWCPEYLPDLREAWLSNLGGRVRTSDACSGAWIDNVRCSRLKYPRSRACSRNANDYGTCNPARNHCSCGVSAT